MPPGAGAPTVCGGSEESERLFQDGSTDNGPKEEIRGLHVETGEVALPSAVPPRRQRNGMRMTMPPMTSPSLKSFRGLSSWLL